MSASTIMRSAANMLPLMGVCLCALLVASTRAMPFSRESVNEYNNMAQMINDAKRYQFYHYLNSGSYYSPMSYSMYLPSKRSIATPLFTGASPYFYLTEPVATRNFNYDDTFGNNPNTAAHNSDVTAQKRAFSSRAFDNNPLQPWDAFVSPVDQKRTWVNPEVLSEMQFPAPYFEK